jgi:HAD superfamily hydrolase (TIGR01549 family)
MIFFDIGNTLEYEGGAVRWRLKKAVHALHEFGISTTEGDLARRLQTLARNRVKSAFKSTVREFSEDDAIYVSVLIDCIWRKDLLKLRDGAKEVLQNLSSKHNLGIIANQSDGAKDRFISYGVGHYFKVFISSFDVGCSKPDEEIFRIGLEQSGESVENVFMVGDRLDNDIGPAKRVGMKTIRVLGCYNDSQQPVSKDEIPDYTIRELKEILDIVG